MSILNIVTFVLAAGSLIVAFILVPY